MKHTNSAGSEISFFILLSLLFSGDEMDSKYALALLSPETEDSCSND